MSQADAPAEHRLHWLLDALRTGPRFRGETFAVAESEVRSLLRSVWDAIDGGEITVSSSVDRLLRRLSRHMDARRAMQRRAGKRRATAPRESVRCSVCETSAGGCALPRQRCLVALQTLPPWLLCEMPVPRTRRRRRDMRRSGSCS